MNSLNAPDALSGTKKGPPFALAHQRDVSADGPPMRIDAEGQWWQGDSPFQREALVRLFARCLVQDEQGQHWIVTPAEKCRIAVADAPLLIVEAHLDADGLACRTNSDEHVVVSPQNPLVLKADASGELRPYVLLRAGIWARLHRNVFYDLLQQAETRPDIAAPQRSAVGITSRGVFWSLGIL